MGEALVAAGAVQAYKDGKGTFYYVYNKFNYSDIEEHYKTMSRKGKQLFARRDGYRNKASRERERELIRECEAWIEQVGVIEKEVLELEKKYTNTKKSTAWRWLHSWPLSNLSQKMEKMVIKLREVLDEGNFVEIMVDKLPKRVQKVNGLKIREDTSMYVYVKEILEHLCDPKVKTIGLWGMPGVGKTTILHNINDDENVASIFDIVIWVTISKNWSIEAIQQQFLRRLGLNVKDYSKDEVAYLISQELERQKYLLILDDVRESLDLWALGIRGNQRDGKIIFSSIYRDNMCSGMKANLINVKALQDYDAWKMFSAKLGEQINGTGIKPIAKQVAKECCGLPLLIDRVARAFARKNTDVQLWESGLNKLRRWPSIQDQGINEVLKFLEFCYHDLEGEDTKKSFLYSALYPEGSKIFTGCLQECWNAEGLLGDVHSLEDGRELGYEILNDLANVSLLERVERGKYTMNKLLRNMALRILSQRENFGLVMKISEPEAQWQKADRISLIDSDLSSELPESPSCGSLQTLLLQKNRRLEVIPRHFFHSMSTLRVLDLHATGVASLPRSVFHLVSLKALYLNSCHNLSEFPRIRNAHLHLQVLDIRGIGINNIPVEVGAFRVLRCLRVSFSNSASSTRVNRYVISRLYSLEELSIDVEPYNQYWDEGATDIASEVAGLTKLVSLCFCFPCENCLETFITPNSLWMSPRFIFRFSVGYHDSPRYRILDYFSSQIKKCLKLTKCEGVHPAIAKILAETEALELINHMDVSTLSEFGVPNLNKMRGCLLESCVEISTIVDGHNITGGVLICLEKLYIIHLPSLVTIWAGPVHEESLTMLTTLDLLGCASLTSIFSIGIIQLLSRLEHMRVEECPQIEELIPVSENRDLQPDSLPMLKTMVLVDLPKLASIWDGEPLKWLSLEKVRILKCNLLKKLPFKTDNATKLKSVEAEQPWWESLVWELESSKERIQSFCVYI